MSSELQFDVRLLGRWRCYLMKAYEVETQASQTVMAAYHRGWLTKSPVHWDQLRAQRSVTRMGELYLVLPACFVRWQLRLRWCLLYRCARWWNHSVAVGLWCVRRSTRSSPSASEPSLIRSWFVVSSICLMFFLGTCEGSRFDSISNRTSDSGFDS